MHILFDIGATNTRIALAKNTQELNEPVVYHTPAEYEDGIKQLTQHIHALVGESPVTAVTGCIAGPWDESKGVIQNSGNLSDWDDKPFRGDLEKTFSCSVHIDNDAACAGLGESVFGAGKDHSSVLYITVSTGVGGTLIKDKRITERLEPRLQVMNEAGDTLGRLISGRGVEKRTGQKPKDISDPVFWDGLSMLLAQALAVYVKDYNPECIVLGGSMMNEVGISVLNTENHLRELLRESTMPVLKHSELGDFGGLYGALALQA